MADEVKNDESKMGRPKIDMPKKQGDFDINFDIDFNLSEIKLDFL
jgi:hypothetical protein